jgi:hypothetical protein
MTATSTRITEGRWYERDRRAYARDRETIDKLADWIKQVDWKLFCTFTFATRQLDQIADHTFRQFMNRLERHLKSDVGYVRGDEKRVSGCGKPACGRHYHALLASAAPLQPAFVEWLWNDVARNPSDDGGAKVELRDEFLNGEIFYSLKEAQILTERWRVEYNTERPHSALGYRPPAPQAILPKPGHGDMENASRFPHLHTPDDDFGQLSNEALH